jgi:hypothetical protein
MSAMVLMSLRLASAKKLAPKRLCGVFVYGGVGDGRCERRLAYGDLHVHLEARKCPRFGYRCRQLKHALSICLPQFYAEYCLLPLFGR